MSKEQGSSGADSSCRYMGDTQTPAPSGKHTPGPWEWDCGLVPPDGPGRYADIYKDGGDLIIAQFNDLIPEGKANARLIAAAPDLLEACEALCAAFGDPLTRRALGGHNEAQMIAILDARAAIAKAEGRS